MTSSAVRKLWNDRHITKNNLSAANWLRYVLKQHEASCWHIDFRFKLNVSLPSWVLPSGLSLRSGESRLAIRVNDHDCRYMLSERVIPPSHYGAGPVLLSDEGFLITLPGFENAGRCLDDGYLKFQLMSTKLNGVWTLKRRRHYANSQHSREWDLTKDAYQSSEGTSAPDTFITDSRSVLSGLTIEDLRRGAKKQVKRASMPSLFED